MFKRIMMGTLAGILAVGLAASSALAFGCPKLIAAGRRLAADASGEKKAKALELLDEAEAAHNGAGKNLRQHGASMAKAADAIDLLTK